MKKIILSFLLSFFVFHSYGQIDNGINKMLEKCIKDSKIKYDAHKEKHPSSSVLFLCYDGLPNPYINNNKNLFDSIDMPMMSWHCCDQYKKELKKGIDLMEVYYELEGNKIAVFVTMSTVKLEKKTLLQEYWFEDVDKYVYEYSCETDEWVLVK